MERADFEKVYTETYAKGLNAARRVDASEAEDGVADAAVYILGNLERMDRLTPSYFVQACVNYTRMRVRRNHRETVSPAGLLSDLDAFTKQGG